MFIAAFFSGQALIQLYWIRQLFMLQPDGYKPIKASAAGLSNAVEAAQQQANDEAIQTAIDYAPIYAVGNICIGELAPSHRC